MSNPIQRIAPPALPVPPADYSAHFTNEQTNIFRLFFNRLTSAVNLAQVQAAMPTVVSFTPSDEPASPSAGDVYYDATTNKLRCYNGTIWNDLF